MRPLSAVTEKQLPVRAGPTSKSIACPTPEHVSLDRPDHPAWRPARSAASPTQNPPHVVQVC